MRLFTGIDIPPEIVTHLLQVMEELPKLPGLRFLSPEKLHLTTTFIGEWPAERLEEMKRALAAIAVPGPIEIRLAHLGWLPNPRFPRVLYAGVSPNEALRQLAEATTRAIAALGLEPEERGFHPHVTLARVNGRPRLNAPPADVGEIGVFQASSFFLYLSADGKYTKLQEFKLPAS
jgi:2'-5' RNA ligase